MLRTSGSWRGQTGIVKGETLEVVGRVSTMHMVPRLASARSPANISVASACIHVGALFGKGSRKMCCQPVTDVEVVVVMQMQRSVGVCRFGRHDTGR